MANQVEIINRSGDKRILLSQSQLARTMAIGSDWTKLRIAFMLSLDGPQADITGTPRLLLGLNAGDTTLPFDETPGHFLGVRTNIAFWDWSTFTTNHYVMGDDEWQIYKNVAGVETTTNLSISGTGDIGISWSQHAFDLDDGPGISIFFVDFEKIDSSTMQVVLAGCRRDQEMGMTQDNLLAAMTLENVAAASSFGTILKTGTPSTIAVDEETDGDLDTICVAWDRLDNLEVSQVIFARLS